jgi:sulfatase maturation enzyme AslB (radical SAM superfamily)
MIEYCRPNFSFIEVYSNGMLIDEKWCEFFKEHRVHIALSIHSYLPEEHDKHVNYKGSHKKVTRAVHLLKKLNIPFRIVTVNGTQSKLWKFKRTTFN